MYHINTSINHFRFSAMRQGKPVSITLYRLEKKGEEIKPSCLTHDEVTRLTQYLVTKDINFHGSKNVHACRASSVPIVNGDIVDFKGSFPRFITMGRNPSIVNYPQKISECMEIELLDENGKRNHDYDLDFEVIGEVISNT